MDEQDNADKNDGDEDQYLAYGIIRDRIHNIVSGFLFLVVLCFDCNSKFVVFAGFQPLPPISKFLNLLHRLHIGELKTKNQKLSTAYIFTFFQAPRRKMITPAILMPASAVSMAMKTPVGPQFSVMARR
jgi:hypothetical protein